MNEMEHTAKAEQHMASEVVKEVEDLHKTDKEGVYIDDLSGKTFSNDTVMEAQRTEFNTLQNMNVYKCVRRTEAQSRDKIIGVR